MQEFEMTNLRHKERFVLSVEFPVGVDMCLE